ncbi:hypothetical protein DIJ64_04050 [Mycobacterium leprae]|uniref:Protein kinase domain-containing protein n=1 Tax=Mycobacterium leprae TaxID=1769 RepID=A0AAD0KUB8_MYCLR|nr:hypothetical protein [Mycobacterium leprae]AWV47551.1 hypothetical protein DIJ64_04050 [Mycobacterium leprae]
MAYRVPSRGCAGGLIRDGVIHRDVKPGNIMVGQQGLRLFGGFRDRALFLTQSGTEIGTYNYVALEWFTGNGLTGRADI